MSLTRRLRSLLAASRRDLVSLWTVMVLVLAVVSVHVLCGVHLDDLAGDTTPTASYAAGHTHDTVGQPVAQDVAGASPIAPAAAGAASGPVDRGDAHGCSDHHTATAQCDPVLPQTPGPAAVPDQTVQWLVRDVADHSAPSLSGGTIASAPSLHALGISRT